MEKTRFKCEYKINNLKLLRDRELGFKRKLGHDDDISRKIYVNLDCYQAEVPLQAHDTHEGGIFNLEFSPDGSLLVAACEERCALLYDASNQRLIKRIEDAHQRCVNCVRFLDSSTFATCSDDGTIKIWDTRNLSTSKRTLQGHANWVKNIEYSEKEKLMVTSAFDGSIYAWDLNSPTENNVLYDKVFQMSGLMRTKITPDCSKMVIATTNGYMVIIHDLNLSTLLSDLKNFRPNLYRLMQLSEQAFPAATMFNYLFYQNRKRNRIEFVDDFPNDAEVISSVQIHPMGWNALSRNVSTEEDQEWTCVHDIQTRDPSDYDDAFSYTEYNCEEEDEENNGPGPTDIWMSFRPNQLGSHRSYAHPNFEEMDRPLMGVINSGLIRPNMYARHFRRRPEDRYKIIKNLPRLTHFVQELPVGKGYIKELCFSTDGRIICSPHNRGVRLLGFNEHLHEVSHCVPDYPKKLFSLSEMKNYHPNVVVSCKFSPRHYQMVSGCLGGRIVWYKPVL